MAMNGINYNNLLGSGLFTNNSLTEEVKNKNNVNGSDKKTADKKTDDKDTAKNTNADKDTFEYSGSAREVKAGYDRPKAVVSKKEPKYKALDSNGIQEGIELSDAAQKLLKELREKYKNMDFAVANWSSDAEQKYYAGFATKEYSVLINPQALEEMAADPAVREKYESVLSGVEGKFDLLKDTLGEDADKLFGFSVSIDKDGTVSYAINLLKSFSENNTNSTKKLEEKREQEKLEEKRIKKKEEQEKRLEKLKEDEDYEKIEANSIEELIEIVKSRLYPEEEKFSVTESLLQTEQVSE